MSRKEQSAIHASILAEVKARKLKLTQRRPPREDVEDVRLRIMEALDAEVAMRPRDDYDVISDNLSRRLLDEPCPHGGGGHMRSDCSMCIRSTLRAAAVAGEKQWREGARLRRIRRGLLRGGK